MLDTTTKRRIDTARDILVGKVPDPKSQVEQITKYELGIMNGEDSSAPGFILHSSSFLQSERRAVSGRERQDPRAFRPLLLVPSERVQPQFLYHLTPRSRRPYRP